MLKTSNRLAQYKNMGRGCAFRERMKKACADRLRARRDEILSGKRNLHETVDSIISEALLSEPIPDDAGIELLEQIKIELLQEEHDEWVAWEEAQTVALYDAHHTEADDQALCPSCHKDNLKFRMNSIGCGSCNFTHIFPIDQVPSPSYLSEWLLRVGREHAEVCGELMRPKQGVQLFVLVCNSCARTATLPLSSDSESSMEM